MWEAACETALNCNIDQPAFKAFLSRWMAATTKVAPWTTDFIMTRLRPSAQAAAASCTGGTTGTFCGTRWWDERGWDGTTGVGQQLSALEVVMATMIREVQAPVTNETGGTSVGNPNAGTVGDNDPLHHYLDITTKDKAGAGVLTAVVLGTLCGGAVWAML